MLLTFAQLFVGLAILAVEAFALLGLVLGAVWLHGKIKGEW